MDRTNGWRVGAIRTLVRAELLAVGVAASWAAPAFAQTYTATDVGTLGGGSTFTHSEAFGVNASAEVVGRSALPTPVPTTGCPPRHRCVVFPEHAYIYKAGTMTDLGTLGGIFSWGTAVNTGDDVAGYSTLSNGTYHAFVVHNGRMTDLGSLAANGASEASGINNFGEVVGWSSVVTSSGSYAQHAFLYVSVRPSPP